MTERGAEELAMAEDERTTVGHGASETMTQSRREPAAIVAHARQGRDRVEAGQQLTDGDRADDRR